MGFLGIADHYIKFFFILAQAVEPSADEGCVVIDSDIDDHESDEDTVCVL